jgi:hypothetical protein
MNVLASLSFHGEASASNAHKAGHKKQHGRNVSSHVLIPSMALEDHQ